MTASAAVAQPEKVRAPSAAARPGNRSHRSPDSGFACDAAGHRLRDPVGDDHVCPRDRRASGSAPGIGRRRSPGYVGLSLQSPEHVHIPTGRSPGCAVGAASAGAQRRSVDLGAADCDRDRRAAGPGSGVASAGRLIVDSADGAVGHVDPQFPAGHAAVGCQYPSSSDLRDQGSACHGVWSRLAYPDAGVGLGDSALGSDRQRDSPDNPQHPRIGLRPDGARQGTSPLGGPVAACAAQWSDPHSDSPGHLFALLVGQPAGCRILLRLARGRSNLAGSHPEQQHISGDRSHGQPWILLHAA